MSSVFPLPDGAGNISIFGCVATLFQFPQEFRHSCFVLVFGHDDTILVPGGDTKVDQLFHDLSQIFLMSLVFPALLFIRFCLDGLEPFHSLKVPGVGAELEMVIPDKFWLFAIVGGLTCSSIVMGMVGPLACHVQARDGCGCAGCRIGIRILCRDGTVRCSRVVAVCVAVSGSKVVGGLEYSPTVLSHYCGSKVAFSDDLRSSLYVTLG